MRLSHKDRDASGRTSDISLCQMSGVRSLMYDIFSQCMKTLSFPETLIENRIMITGNLTLLNGFVNKVRLGFPITNRYSIKVKKRKIRFLLLKLGSLRFQCSTINISHTEGLLQAIWYLLMSEVRCPKSDVRSFFLLLETGRFLDCIIYISQIKHRTPDIEWSVQAT